MRKKQALRAVALGNSKRRRAHMRMACFPHQALPEMRRWVAGAIEAAARRAWALKRPLLKDRSKRLPVDDAARVRETLTPLNAFVMGKVS